MVFRCQAKHAIASVVVLLLLSELSGGRIPGPVADPIFVPIKIDGPVHDPAKGSFWYGPFSEGVAVFDLDGDQDLDITCGSNWYEGPRWQKHERLRDVDVTGEFVSNCGEYAIDVDGDKRLDLVSAGWFTNGIFWYRNPGRRDTKWEAVKIMSSDFTEGLVVEDVDGDGDPDILVNHWAPREGQGVTWIELLGGGKFAVHIIGQKGDEHGIGLGDLNGDARKDIVTPAGWYEAPPDRAAGEWKFHDSYRLPKQLGIRMIVTDVNGDGTSDIIYGRGHDYGLGWLEQSVRNGIRTFTDHVIEDSLGQFHTLVMAEVDQDGAPDLVTGKRLRGHGGDDPSSFDPLGVYWYDIRGGRFIRHVLSYNHLPWYPGTETRNPPPNFAIGTGMNINVVDVNNDGRVDIVVAGKSGLYLFENRGRPPTRRMDRAESR